MKLLLLIALLMIRSALGAHTITDIRFEGSDRGEISFLTKEMETIAPQVKVSGNLVELSFVGTGLEAGLKGKVFESSHPLFNRMTVQEESNRTVIAKLVVAGSNDRLKERIVVQKEEGKVRVFVDYPAVPSGQAKKSEDMPVLAGKSDAKETDKAKSPGVLIALFFLVLGGAVGTIFLIKFSRNKGFQKGPRKYLIEQMAYHSLGNRSGVSLLKVGNDFVLVGVTPNQITMLSELPELKKRYQDESSFERDSFTHVVSDELGKLQGKGKNLGFTA